MQIKKITNDLELIQFRYFKNDNRNEIRDRQIIEFGSTRNQASVAKAERKTSLISMYKQSLFKISQLPNKFMGILPHP